MANKIPFEGFNRIVINYEGEAWTASETLQRLAKRTSPEFPL